MIRHIVFFSAKDKANIPYIIDILRGYAAIPGVEQLEVSENIRRDTASQDIDIILHAIFADEAALEAYKQHPLYHEGIRVIRPLRELRYVADYVV